MDKTKKTAPLPTSVRLPADIKEKLEQTAIKERRSLSNMIVIMIEEYIRNHQTD